ncbi:MAG TPA: hypothetical protein VEC16_05840 [Alphaproteobacteria bacterium]|nr:hypothetical protein [Alphaproteobacteria bacterium]
MTQEQQKKISIEDFLVKGRVLFSFPGTREFDYGKILALDDKDFLEFYKKLMEEYKDHDGYWKEGNPKCWECQQDILAPLHMRKYNGQTLHGPCFTQVYLNDSPPQNKTIELYFNRVAALTIKDI